jgi:adenylate cyclase
MIEDGTAILHDLRALGAADYLALPAASGHGARNYMITYVTDRRGGFTESEVADLTRVSQRLPILLDMHNQRAIARNVVNAYLGAKTGPKVLAGRIRRGTGEEISAVLWCSDLRGFTARSDQLPGDRMIALLNALFDAQAKAIHHRGGEILKFIGDGLLAVFPIERAETAAGATRQALEAAMEALVAVHREAVYDRLRVDARSGWHTGTRAGLESPHRTRGQTQGGIICVRMPSAPGADVSASVRAYLAGRP